MRLTTHAASLVTGKVSLENHMPITNNTELKAAVCQAGDLLQEIQDYCGRTYKVSAQVRFPRGFLRTAGEQRGRLNFVDDNDLKSNLAYCLILSDAIHWLLTRTDIAATAREMLIKLQIFIGGTLIESVTTNYLKNVRTPKRTYKMRTQSLVDLGIIDTSLKDELDWIWDLRNNMHLFGLVEREYINEYNTSSQARAAKGFRDFIEILQAKGRI